MNEIVSAHTTSIAQVERDLRARPDGAELPPFPAYAGEAGPVIIRISDDDVTIEPDDAFVDPGTGVSGGTA